LRQRSLLHAARSARLAARSAQRAARNTQHERKWRGRPEQQRLPQWEQRLQHRLRWQLQQCHYSSYYSSQRKRHRSGSGRHSNQRMRHRKRQATCSKG
jgi:hypothetical protein